MIDSAGAVELFEEEKVGHVVGGGHGGEGETEGGAGFEAFREAAGAAEDDGDVVTEVLVSLEEGGEGFAAVFWADSV